LGGTILYPSASNSASGRARRRIVPGSGARSRT